jgi:DNA-binding XRE family transcriptional regulator
MVKIETSGNQSYNLTILIKGVEYLALRKGSCRLHLLLGDMSQAEFARRMKVAESTVSRWVKNDREMTYENAVLASRILNCHAEDIYNWIEVSKGKRQ